MGEIRCGLAATWCVTRWKTCAYTMPATAHTLQPTNVVHWLPDSRTGHKWEEWTFTVSNASNCSYGDGKIWTNQKNCTYIIYDLFFLSQSLPALQAFSHDCQWISIVSINKSESYMKLKLIWSGVPQGSVLELVCIIAMLPFTFWNHGCQDLSLLTCRSSGDTRGYLGDDERSP